MATSTSTEVLARLARAARIVVDCDSRPVSDPGGCAFYSGGQTGVDVAALRAARRAGLETGGTMPRGWRTLDGPRPGYAVEFGLVQHPFSSAYPPRTLANVLAADATLRIAADLGSPGELTTWAAIVRARSRHLDVRLERVVGLPTFSPDREAEEVARWIVEHRVATLNVAGNSERTTPGIERAAESYLDDVFARLRAIDREIPPG